MTQFTTELLNFLAQKQDIDEFFRTSLETAMNDLLQAELSFYELWFNSVVILFINYIRGIHADFSY